MIPIHGYMQALQVEYKMSFSILVQGLHGHWTVGALAWFKTHTKISMPNLCFGVWDHYCFAMENNNQQPQK